MAQTPNPTPLWKKLFSFRGRARRRDYWRIFAATFAFAIVLQFALAVPGAFLVALPLALANNIVQWAVMARRLHDLDRSGWWQVPALGLALMVTLRAASLGLPNFQNPKPMPPEIALGALLMLVFFVVIGAVRGDPGPNRFGDPPA